MRNIVKIGQQNDVAKNEEPDDVSFAFQVGNQLHAVLNRLQWLHRPRGQLRKNRRRNGTRSRTENDNGEEGGV